jgi:hypothetical protein
MDFSREGKYLALAERRECKDFVSIFLCSTWQLVKVSRLFDCLLHGTLDLYSIEMHSLAFKNYLVYMLDKRVLGVCDRFLRNNYDPFERIV